MQKRFALNCLRSITNIKIYKRTSSADIPCSEHCSFNLFCINPLVFSYSLDTSLITVRYILIFVFEFIMDCTDPVDRYHSKCLLAKRICKNGCIDYKLKNHMILYRLCDWLKNKNQFISCILTKLKSIYLLYYDKTQLNLSPIFLQNLRHLIYTF